MSEAVRKPGQGRDGAVQPQIHARNAEPGLSGIAWKPRADDRTARQVNDRGTVFDRPLPGLEPVDPEQAAIAEISDPIWNHRGFTAWTPDLVHCRLLVCGQTIKGLPPVLRRQFLSQAGSLAIAEMPVSERVQPTPGEISALDWTWPRLVRLVRGEPSTIQRILMASAMGASLDEIVKVLGAVGIDKGKSTIRRWYMAEKLRLAADWQACHQPVDVSTVRRWDDIFNKAPK